MNINWVSVYLTAFHLSQSVLPFLFITTMQLMEDVTVKTLCTHTVKHTLMFIQMLSSGMKRTFDEHFLLPGELC